MTVIIAAMGEVFGLVGTVITEITGEPVLLFFLAASMVPIGIGLFARLKRSVR